MPSLGLIVLLKGGWISGQQTFAAEGQDGLGVHRRMGSRDQTRGPIYVVKRLLFKPWGRPILAPQGGWIWSTVSPNCGRGVPKRTSNGKGVRKSEIVPG